jgi:type IV pilus assembly protein PilA
MNARRPLGTRTDERGFTLIELLVVMVIIGILAAIAIPSFLAQRDKGYQAAEKSDLKTVAIAEQSYATDFNGAFTADSGITVATTAASDPLVAQGAKVSVNVTIKAKLTSSDTSKAATTNDGFCLDATSSKSNATWYLSSANDTPAQGACP